MDDIKIKSETDCQSRPNLQLPKLDILSTDMSIISIATTTETRINNETRLFFIIPKVRIEKPPLLRLFYSIESYNLG